MLAILGIFVLSAALAVALNWDVLFPEGMQEQTYRKWGRGDE